jgi:hypothetical protein
MVLFFSSNCPLCSCSSSCQHSSHLQLQQRYTPVVHALDWPLAISLQAAGQGPHRQGAHCQGMWLLLLLLCLLLWATLFAVAVLHHSVLLAWLHHAPDNQDLQL